MERRPLTISIRICSYCSMPTSTARSTARLSRQASRYAVGGVTAAMLLDQLSPKFAEAQVVPTDDARIAAEYVEYDSPNGYGKMRGYLVRPAKADRQAAGRCS